MLFTSALDPSMFAYAAQRGFIHRNGKVSGELPIGLEIA